LGGTFVNLREEIVVKRTASVRLRNEALPSNAWGRRGKLRHPGHFGHSRQGLANGEKSV